MKCRKNVKNLTPDERKRFVNAFVALKAQDSVIHPGSQSRYDDFVEYHLNAMTVPRWLGPRRLGLLSVAPRAALSVREAAAGGRSHGDHSVLGLDPAQDRGGRGLPVQARLHRRGRRRHRQRSREARSRRACGRSHAPLHLSVRPPAVDDAGRRQRRADLLSTSVRRARRRAQLAEQRLARYRRELDFSPSHRRCRLPDAANALGRHPQPGASLGRRKHASHDLAERSGVLHAPRGHRPDVVDLAEESACRNGVVSATERGGRPQTQRRDDLQRRRSSPVRDRDNDRAGRRWTRDARRRCLVRVGRAGTDQRNRCDPLVRRHSRGSHFVQGGQVQDKGMPPGALSGSPAHRPAISAWWTWTVSPTSPSSSPIRTPPRTSSMDMSGSSSSQSRERSRTAASTSTPTFVDDEGYYAATEGGEVPARRLSRRPDCDDGGSRRTIRWRWCWTAPGAWTIPPVPRAPRAICSRMPSRSFATSCSRTMKSPSVTFDDVVDTPVTMQQVSGAPAFSTIDLVPRNSTWIGGGIQQGAVQLAAAAHTNRSMIVLTDGNENVHPYIGEIDPAIAHEPDLRDRLRAAGHRQRCRVAADHQQHARRFDHHRQYLHRRTALQSYQVLRPSAGGRHQDGRSPRPAGQPVPRLEARHSVPAFGHRRVRRHHHDMPHPQAHRFLAGNTRRQAHQTLDGSRANPISTTSVGQQVAFYRIVLPALAADAAGSHAGNWNAILSLKGADDLTKLADNRAVLAAVRGQRRSRIAALQLCRARSTRT